MHHQDDWRKCEARLNALQFTTEIDGVKIHFIHVKSRHENALPLIMTHGWPGSVIELLETVGPLTDPTSHGGTPGDAFRLGQRVAAILRRSSTISFSGMLTRNGRIAVLSAARSLRCSIAVVGVMVSCPPLVAAFTKYRDRDSE